MNPHEQSNDGVHHELRPSGFPLEHTGSEARSEPSQAHHVDQRPTPVAPGDASWPCEACGERESSAMWNPDNLGGHETLVCSPCYHRLLAGERVFKRTRYPRAAS